MKRREIKCLKCGHKWLAIVDRPACCPRCKNRKYYEPRVYALNKISEPYYNKESNKSNQPTQQDTPNKIRRPDFE